MAVLLDGARCDLGQLHAVPPPVGDVTVPSQGCRWEVMCSLPPLNLCLTFWGAHTAWKKLGQSARLFSLWENLLLWVVGCQIPILCGGRS